MKIYKDFEVNKNHSKKPLITHLIHNFKIALQKPVHHTLTTTNTTTTTTGKKRERKIKTNTLYTAYKQIDT